VETGEDVHVVPSLWWGDDQSAPGPSWEILGDHRPGTYAEMVRVPRECVVPKPTRLSWLAGQVSRSQELGAANRAEAVCRYLRMQATRQQNGRR
jgi:hypothetical protein